MTPYHPRWPRSLSLYLFAVLALLTPLDCPGREHLVLEVVLNTERKGEFFAYLTPDGDCLLNREDLTAMGFTDPTGMVSVTGGETFISLRSMKGVSFAFDQETVSLDIVAEAHLLRRRSIDVRPARRTDIYHPKDTGAFFNYGLNYAGDGLLNYRSFAGTTQLGARMGDILFLNDSLYTRGDSVERFVRLSTNMTCESRHNLNRAVVGDLYAASGYLGSAVNMGGIGLSRNFSIDPYFIKQPMVDYTGFATLPSEVGVSVDGTRIRSDRVGPGPFDLKNILSFNGVHNLEIAVRDAFGREETVRYPFYSSDVLLRAGLHEFSYNAGFLRNNYGIDSNDYGRFAAFFFHNYGATDSLTVGARGESSSHLVNIGPRMSFLIRNYGVLSLSGAASADRDGVRSTGYAGSLGYSYRRRNINLRFLYAAYTQGYSTVTPRTVNDRKRYELGTTIGYGTGTLGSISLDYAGIGRYTGQERQSVTLSYSRGITRDSNLYFSIRHTKDEVSSTEISLGLTFHLWKDVMLSVNLQKDSGGESQGVQMQKNAPVGEGFGYRVSASREELPDTRSLFVTPYIQYNGPYGIYSAELSGKYPAGATNSSESIRLNASGGIAYVGRTIAFGRPISDSYGVVKVGDLKGVRVYHNNHLIGRTDGTGKAFIPVMASYQDNYVSIDDRDVPVEYSLEKVGRYVLPPLRSGTFLSFDAVRVRAFTGRIERRTREGTTPLGLCEAKLTVDGKEVPFVTDARGEFYLENIPAGSHRGGIEKAGRTYYITIRIPQSDDTMVDLGGILVEEQY